MSRLARVLRWVIAAQAAAVAFIAGFVLFVMISQHIGGVGGAGVAYAWSVAFGTIAGAVVGSFIAPPDQRKLASRVFVGALVALLATYLIVSFVDHTFKFTNALDVAGSLLGGGIVLRLFN